jgi:hypothetical protein
MASVAQLKQIIKENEAGQYWADYGPFKLGTTTVYEIWTIGHGEDPEGPVSSPEIRFWLEGEDGEEKYFECFPALAEHLDKRFTSAARTGADVELAKEKQAEALKLKGISLYVASIVFIAAVGSMIVAFYRDPSYLVAVLLGGVIASACVLFFGVWQPITFPDLPDWLRKITGQNY